MPITFLILGDVGTGKSTVTPIYEFNLCNKNRLIVIREPSRAACNALYYSLEALYPEIKDDLAVITKDTRINAENGRIRIVTDGVLLRMLAEGSITDASIYFDESHQLTSQLELCMSLAKKDSWSKKPVESDERDPRPERVPEFSRNQELLLHLGKEISSIDTARDGKRPRRDVRQTLSLSLLATSERILAHLPPDKEARREVLEKLTEEVHIHGGLEGSEINKIQQRAEIDKNLKIFATNVIASSVNIFVDNVLVFNEVVDGKDRLGQKELEYKTIDNNSLLQMMGRVGRFKPGRAVLLSDTPIPKVITPRKVRKSLERETPFDLVLLMSKYRLETLRTGIHVQTEPQGTGVCRELAL